jgi:hypothetical protein
VSVRVPSGVVKSCCCAPVADASLALLQTVTLELAALMDRAKQLLGVPETGPLSRYNDRSAAVSPSGHETSALITKRPPPMKGDIPVRPTCARGASQMSSCAKSACT